MRAIGVTIDPAPDFLGGCHYNVAINIRIVWEIRT